MNFKIQTLIAALALGCCAPSLSAKLVKIDTKSTTMLLDAVKGKKLKYMYYGTLLSDSDTAAIRAAVGKGQNAYPDYGMLGPDETAIAMIQPDGNRTLNLVVDEIIDGRKWEASKLAENGNASTGELKDGAIYTVRLRDTYYPVTVDINYGVNAGYGGNDDVLETWVDITNDGKKPVTLTRFASGFLPIRYGNVWVSQFYGSAKNEARIDCTQLVHGLKTIKNRDGVRNSHTAHSEVMISLDGKPRENDGRVIGAALCYSGNYKLTFDTDRSDYHHFIAGIDEADSEYHLAGGETFSTPHLALTFSTEGLGGVSRAFHHWGRNFKLAHGNDVRPVLLNSWEGVYFNINEKGMNAMMHDIASMGGELFVMDDGWFGPEYHRDNAKAGLGDWTVDTRKLPKGINGLLKTARKEGIKFGIWIEPEMVNSNSELYKEHPEYILKPANREPVYGRGGTQLVLDLANPAVQDIVFTVVDTLLTKYPEIAYIKWDANMNIKNHGSQYLGSDKQSHLFIEFHRGFEKVLNRIRAKYPDVLIQACASGGGRANWGVLPWFDEFWVSDNTDALQRIYMQWGHSYFYPALTMASHISASPNHQTQRIIPLKYRTDVAMSARLGMEIQPMDMTDAEKAQTRKAIDEYKAVRDVIQLGDLYRLASPYDENGVASLLYANESKEKAVFFWWRTRTFFADQLPMVRMDGLDPNKTYRIHELNRIDNQPMAIEGQTYSGKFLMEHGLEMPYSHTVAKAERTAWSSRVLLLEAVK